MERILVTGGAGFLGSHVCERLLARGAAVRALDAFDPYYDPARKRRTAAALAARGVEVREGDVLDREVLAAALAGVDAVVHLAARPGVRASIDDPETSLRINVLGTLSVLEGLRRSEVQRLVFASSSSVYGGDAEPPFREDAPANQPLSPYAASKRAGEHLCATYATLHGLGVFALRFFTIYGPRGRPDMAVGKFVDRALAGEPVPLYGDGSVVREFTYVDDAVEGVLAALDRTAPGGGYALCNVGGGASASVRELIAAIEDAVGCPLRVERRPPAAGDMPATGADLARARALLGYAPRVSLAEGLARTVAWARAERAAHASE
ncbi:MAG: NAD-dependent epimerase/dehydratase family protein [Planctomycetota bacterium]|nr:MAG: NAD-dependent epimerase/dehydratase family protein [Planctomycetota bacterium]